MSNIDFFCCCQDCKNSETPCKVYTNGKTTCTDNLDPKDWCEQCKEYCKEKKS